MKKPIIVIWNDSHLKTGNEQEVLKSVQHLVKFCVEKNIKDVVFAGDLFDSRSFQRQEVLKTADAILNLFYINDLTLTMFPGNHDKTIYASYDSFLDIYRYHPNVYLYNDVTNIEIGGVKITLLPFFSNDMLVPKIEEHEGGDILISHFEMNGSSNLGHVIDDSPINRGMLKKWKKTYLGHFHNTMEITKDIVHLPSLRQNNFGEDSNKGFSIIYDDLSYEIVPGDFRKFSKVKIDLNNVTIKELKKLIQVHQDSTDIVRFEITGDENKLKALDKEIFKDTNIDVKIEYKKKYDIDELEVPTFVKTHTKNSIVPTFESFCNDKGYDIEVGTKLLLEFLNK